MSTAPDPNYIAIEGPIGVGKTTLATRLAQSLSSDLVLEAAPENPFLPKFYERPKELALPTQLYFLFQRTRQIQSLRQADMFQPVCISDFLLEKDRVFAELTLSEDELRLYDQVFHLLTPETPTPDLVIYLQAPVAVLLERIGRRGIDYEKHIDESYLSRLVEAYVAFFYHYDKAPLLIINAAEVNFADNEQHYRLLLERIRTPPHGKHYFNPSPMASTPLG